MWPVEPGWFSELQALKDRLLVGGLIAVFAVAGVVLLCFLWSFLRELWQQMTGD